MNNVEDELFLLGFFVEKPIHGYDLHKQLNGIKGLGLVWKLKIGKLYQLIAKLEGRGLLVPQERRLGNRPSRIEFQITEKGRAQYYQWILSPVMHGRDFRIKFLTKLYFAIKEGQEFSDELIIKQQNSCEKWKKQMIKPEAELEQEEMFNAIVHQFRISQMDAYRSWLIWCQNFLNKEKP